MHDISGECVLCVLYVPLAKPHRMVSARQLTPFFIFTIIFSKYILELCFVCAILSSGLVLSGLPTKIYFHLCDARQVMCPACLLHSKCM